MAKTVGTSSILAAVKQRAKGAWEEARKVEAKKGFISLPAGLRGIARLVNATLRMSKESEQGTSPEVSLKFIVREPIDHEGGQAYKSHYINEKKGKFPKSIGEVLAALSSDLQNCGVVRDEDVGLKDIDDWPEMLADLSAAKPYVHFRTWQPPDSDKVIFFIDGPVKEEIAASFAENPTEAPDDLEEVVAAAEAGKPAPAAKGPPPKGGGKKGPPPKKPAAPAAEEPEEVSEVEEVVDKSVPEVDDRCYLTVKGDQRTCIIREVDADTQYCVLEDEDGGKKYKASFSKIEADNPAE